MKAMNIVKRVFAVIFFLLAIAAALWAVRVERYALAAEPLVERFSVIEYDNEDIV